MYAICSDGSGRKVIRRPERAEEIPFDTNDQRFNGFISRWSQGLEAVDGVDPFVPPGYYFSEKRSLIQHCRGCGVVLKVDFDGDKGRFDLVKNAVHVDGQAYHQLSEAIADPCGRRRVESELASRPVNIFVTDRLWSSFRHSLANENSRMRKLSSWPVDRAFAYFDVSDCSAHPPSHQMLIVNSIGNLMNHGHLTRDRLVNRFKLLLETMLCIGDGYILVFRDAISAVYVSAILAREIELRSARRELPVKFHFRAGIHFGSVYRFWDSFRRDWNYIGDGINGGQRVLSAIGKETDDVLYVSGEVRDELLKAKDRSEPLPKIIGSLQNQGRRKDKHGNDWRVYELNHTQLFENFTLPDVPSFAKPFYQRNGVDESAANG